MAADKPSVVVIAGAYHTPAPYKPFIDSLRRAGYDADAYALASFGDASKSVNDDEAHIRSLIAERLDKGQDVVLLAHSFAAFGASGAISGLDKKKRAEQGEKSALLGIVLLSAFIPLEGESVFSILDAPHPSAVVKEDEGLVYMNDGESIFYNDCSDEAAQAAKAQLSGQSLQSFSAPPSKIGWREPGFEGRRAYIRCLRDNTLPLALQDKYLAQTGAKWLIRSIETSHSPFLSKPDDLTKVLSDLVCEFATAP